jgi:hypothetical protein
MTEAYPSRSTEPPYVRHSVTSERAAEEIRPSAARLRARVLAAIKAAGAAGLTDEECQRITGLEGSTQRPRRGELAEPKIGPALIRKANFTRQTSSGRSAVVWIASQREGVGA